jgi:hypothetical protein
MCRETVNAEHRGEVASQTVCLLLGLAAAADKYEDAPHDVRTVRREQGARIRIPGNVHIPRRAERNERLGRMNTADHG